jgi:hypothetical protein
MPRRHVDDRAMNARGPVNGGMVDGGMVDDRSDVARVQAPQLGQRRNRTERHATLEALHDRRPKRTSMTHHGLPFLRLDPPTEGM